MDYSIGIKILETENRNLQLQSKIGIKNSEIKNWNRIQISYIEYRFRNQKSKTKILDGNLLSLRSLLYDTKKT
jgi:hypothetical protein